MIDALYIGASGLKAQQLHVDTVANNLANVNTAAYKRSEVSFEDVMYREVRRANGLAGEEGNHQLMGSGVDMVNVRKVFTMGDLKKTDNAFDLAIRGSGFLEATTPDGRTVYTRAGHLIVNADGMLATPEGYALRPNISMPADAVSIEISADGVVQATYGDGRNPEELGQIELTMFTNPAGLVPMGENLYRSAEAAGEPTYGKPGEDGRGNLAQGFQEASNVKLADEMVALMVAQRGYELSAKVVQVSDELMSMSNNLRR